MLEMEMKQTDLLTPRWCAGIWLCPRPHLSLTTPLCASLQMDYFIKHLGTKQGSTRDYSMRNEWVMIPTWIQVPSLLERLLRRARAIAMTTDYKTHGNRKTKASVAWNRRVLRQETACNIHVLGFTVKSRTTRTVKEQSLPPEQGDAYGRTAPPNIPPLSTTPPTSRPFQLPLH